MVNDALPDALRMQFSTPATVVSGDPIMVGMLAGFAEASYRADTGETPIQFNAAKFYPVTGASALSPFVAAALGPGDRVYADGGVLDPVTNCLTGFTLSGNPAGPYFGNVLDWVPAGTTITVRVRPKVSGGN